MLNDDEEEQFMQEWSLGDYDNGENGFPHCGRHRLCICQNGKHRCEKCNWSPELNDYVPIEW
ncbi:TPA: hypothetical protein ACLFWE_001755 [Salmonella enterica subsp. houtenae serovar O:57:z4,z32:-]|nr:hypothetical protein [Salmonella enterica subsp. houtenae]ELD5978710.1 hypothetical protein [Salmonella enterica]MDJ4623942.1 hypothetical protein [Salmonella enterica]MDJ8397683.1 hypothetical protein [Salmonella enterica]